MVNIEDAPFDFSGNMNNENGVTVVFKAVAKSIYSCADTTGKKEKPSHDKPFTFFGKNKVGLFFTRLF